MKNWKLIAEGLGADLSESEIEATMPALDGLEAAFRPLAGGLPIDTEPAVIFDPSAELLP